MALAESPKTRSDEPKPAKAGPLGRAGESSDPAVQHAMAVLNGERMNREALNVEKADVDAADQRVEDARQALADLGYE